MSEVSVENTGGRENLSWLRIIKLLLIVIFSVVILLIISFILYEPIPRERAERITCMANMKQLGLAFIIYAQDHSDSYPTSEKWCDLLLPYFKMESDVFICKGSDTEKDQSSYCFNKNVIGKKYSEIPSDTVLLFETKKGWNQVGGPEILTFNNHEGKGCSVLFNDGRVEFVKKEDFGELKWGTEKKESESIE